LLAQDAFAVITPTLDSTDFSQSYLTIEANGYPYGLFAFNSSFTASSYDMHSSPQINLRIDRNQGMYDNSEVGWMAVSGSERLKTSSGVVSFTDLQPAAYVNVPIVADSMPHGDETIVFVLTNATHGAVESGSVSTTLLATNNARGLFGFAEFSLASVVWKNPQSDTKFTLTIIRTVGAADDVNVTYIIVDSFGAYLSPSTADVFAIHSGARVTSGLITFAAGQLQASLELFVASFANPELTRVYSIRLTNASRVSRNDIDLFRMFHTNLITIIYVRLIVCRKYRQRSKRFGGHCPA
jgi:hypothetical protein